MIREFINKFVVHTKESQNVQSSPQKAEKHLNLIGEFELLSAESDEPTLVELAEQERIEKEREYNRRWYLKRKASGYCDKPKAEPKIADKKTA